MKNRLLPIFMVVLIFVAFSQVGNAQTWHSYPKANGQGQLVIEGNYLWSAGELLYRYDISSGAWRMFGRDDGLPENALNCIALDSGGAKWIGTQDRGLWSFDGNEFHRLDLDMPSAPESVSILMTDPTDRIWFAKKWSEGLWVSDGLITLCHGESSGLIGRVKSITWGPGDTAWCTTNNSVYRLDGDTWTELKTAGDYYFDTIFADRSGTVWVTQSMGPILRYNGDTWTSCSIPGADSFNPFSGFSEGPDGTIWLANYRCLARFDGAEWTSFKVGDGMPSEWPDIIDVSSTAVDDNNVLYASCNLGIISYDGQQWSIIGPLSNVPVNNLTAASWANDRLFFGTWDNGLGEFDGLQWRMDRDDSAGSNAPFDVVQYDPERDVTWYGGERSGFGCFGPGAGEYTGGSDANRPKSGKCMTLDQDGNVWVGSGSNIHKWDGYTWTKYTDEDGLLPVESFTGIAASHDGSIWAVGRCVPASMIMTASVFDNGTWTVKTFDDISGQAADITSDALGGVWGLLQMVDIEGNCKVVRLSLDGVLAEWDMAGGGWGLQKIFVSPQVNGIWLVGEYGALRLFDDEWRLVTPAEGLASGSVYSVAFAPNNVTWFCTGTSLCRLDESPIPWVRLYAAGGTGGTLDFKSGDTLDVQAELHNPMTECSVSIYVAVRLPNDPTLFFWPSFSTQQEAAFTGTLSDKMFLGPLSLFTHTFSGQEPPGTYSIFSAVFSNETSEMIGDIQQVDIDFTAGQ
ncbi:hypothetical protein J7M28_02945 [bacterium]|nr:hypothetical protein [bacterium]